MTSRDSSQWRGIRRSDDSCAASGVSLNVATYFFWEGLTPHPDPPPQGGREKHRCRPSPIREEEKHQGRPSVIRGRENRQGRRRQVENLPHDPEGTKGREKNQGRPSAIRGRRTVRADDGRLKTCPTIRRPQRGRRTIRGADHPRLRFGFRWGRATSFVTAVTICITSPRYVSRYGDTYRGDAGREKVPEVRNVQASKELKDEGGNRVS
jgi:hypothetical protein